MTSFRIIGPGRAGGAFAAALTSVGWIDRGHLNRQDPLRDAGSGVDAVLVTVPDDAIERVARAIDPSEAALIHVSGSQPLDALGNRHRVGSVHPLMSLPDATIGAERLLDHCVFAVAGDPLTIEMVDALGGTAISVADADRAAYHAAASIAANHLVALCSQVEALATTLGIPRDAYWRLMSTTIDNVAEAGATAALTGPAARGDWQTIRRHLDALPPPERALYRVLSERAAELAGHRWPDDLS